MEFVEFGLLQVQHLVEDGKIHLLICAKKDIAKGSEITIPFDYNYQAW